MLILLVSLVNLVTFIFSLHANHKNVENNSFQLQDQGRSLYLELVKFVIVYQFRNIRNLAIVTAQPAML
ncbi:hypothetical protein A6770_39750 [Nostoc minutum NIES-26]|uniref:Uncharacterized protein n=1 Tax=Nostoc minutum NIES-26 TaxID=1844469 RepID=A0A367RNX9_9NOSO|nr:hypothetical protein A6770_39750 [Nostoc minutum NIES-26]